MIPFGHIFPDAKVGSLDFGALLLFLFLCTLWNFLRRRKATYLAFVHGDDRLITDVLGPIGYGKALLSWIFLFMRVFSVSPGLYFLNARDDQAPLLVTANNFLTVFLLARRVGKRNVRLLVIDTEGINVWCSAGKGRFSAREVIDKATLAGLICGDGKKVKIILPKFSLAGVRLSELRRAGLDPVIGPLYAKDLPAFLDGDSLKDCAEDRVDFGIRSRAFTALPTAVQFFYYFLGAYVASLFTAPLEMIWLATFLAFLYPLLLPVLPGKMFAVKGLWLAAAFSGVVVPLSGLPVLGASALAGFLTATCLFIALSYTGNSATSCYSGVRRETAFFLPATVFLYMVTGVLYYW